MTTAIPVRAAEHVDTFNRAVREGDFTAFLAGFAPDAVMRFTGVSAGPFHGPAAIARAYTGQPPNDTMTIRSCRSENDYDIVRFAWDAGGLGHLRLRWRDGLLIGLDVAFDPHPLPAN